MVPDQVGSYTIESTVKVNGSAIPDPPRFLLEVARTTSEALAQVIAELEALSVAPGDRGQLQAAISLLRTAQGLPTDPLGLEGRIRLAAEAAEKLGRIQSADVSRLRGEVDRLIAAWEHASYELAVALPGRAAQARARDLSTASTSSFARWSSHRLVQQTAARNSVLRTTGR